MEAAETTAPSFGGKPLDESAFSSYSHADYWSQEPATAQQSFLESWESTVWRTIPVLEFLQEIWGTTVNNPDFYKLADAIESGLANLCKWYHKTDDTDMYFICLGKCC